MLVFLALGDAKMLSFALGDAKVPDARYFAFRWNIGFGDLYPADMGPSWMCDFCDFCAFLPGPFLFCQLFCLVGLIFSPFSFKNDTYSKCMHADIQNIPK